LAVPEWRNPSVTLEFRFRQPSPTASGRASAASCADRSFSFALLVTILMRTFAGPRRNPLANKGFRARCRPWRAIRQTAAKKCSPRLARSIPRWGCACLRSCGQTRPRTLATRLRPALPPSPPAKAGAAAGWASVLAPPGVRQPAGNTAKPRDDPQHHNHERARRPADLRT